MEYYEIKFVVAAFLRSASAESPFFFFPRFDVCKAIQVVLEQAKVSELTHDDVILGVHMLSDGIVFQQLQTEAIDTALNLLVTDGILDKAATSPVKYSLRTAVKRRSKTCRTPRIQPIHLLYANARSTLEEKIARAVCEGITARVALLASLAHDFPAYDKAIFNEVLDRMIADHILEEQSTGLGMALRKLTFFDL
jgi:hypothetical protein